MKLAFISNDSARNCCFRRRMKGMNKKLSELSTLCGIDACAIVYTPNEPQPEVWPNSMGVQNVLAQFLRMPDMDKFKHMVNQERYIRERINKADKELKKQINENWEKEMTETTYQCLIGETLLANLNMTNLDGLGSLVDQNLSEINSRIELLHQAVPADTVEFDGMQYP